MRQSTKDKIGYVRDLLIVKYPGYMTFAPGERALLCVAWLNDVVKVREVGNNRGEWVSAFLDSAGVSDGNPWCASLLTFACRVANASIPHTGPAAVRSWRSMFEATGKLTQKPNRGDICMRNHGGGKGHIGIVVKVFGPLVFSIEGNTSSGESGSQRDGDGLFRRKRLSLFWSWGFGKLSGA